MIAKSEFSFGAKQEKIFLHLFPIPFLSRTKAQQNRDLTRFFSVQKLNIFDDIYYEWLKLLLNVCTYWSSIK